MLTNILVFLMFYSVLIIIQLIKGANTIRTVTNKLFVSRVSDHEQEITDEDAKNVKRITSANGLVSIITFLGILTPYYLVMVTLLILDNVITWLSDRYFKYSIEQYKKENSDISVYKVTRNIRNMTYFILILRLIVFLYIPITHFGSMNI